MYGSTKRGLALALVLAMLLSLFCGCAGETTPAESTAAPSESIVTQPTQAQVTEPEDAVDKSVYMDPSRSVEERVEALLAQMTLEEKAAQMLQPEQNGINLGQIRRYGVGSVLSGGGSAPKTGNSAEDWQKHINSIKQAALESRLGIPVLYGVDAVHGHSNIYGAVVYPHNIGLGAANDEELMVRIGAAVAEEVRATGIHWTFAPTLANPRNELWGRTYEGFGEDADLVAKLGAAFIRGAQGENGTEEFLSDTHVVATAKHYIGEGYTTSGINQGNVEMSAEEFEALLRETLLVPYAAAVNENVRTVMASFNSVNGLKCHENGYLLNDVLKGDLGFTGLVVGDYNGVQQVSGRNYKEQIVNAVNAGVDLLMEPYTWEEAIRHIVSAVEDGSISQERLDDAVRRILRVKFEAGLFEEQIGSDTEQQLMANFGSDDHREIARDAVRKSLVLLKNDKIGNYTAMDALSGTTHIAVVGTKADDIGAQCGGWTISWQGSTGDITEGTTILEALRTAAGDRTFTYSPDGTLTGEEDAIIVVLGETPYAETAGDRSTSSLTVSMEDKVLMHSMEESLAQARKAGKPVILLLLTGRPVTIAQYVDSFDAIIAAWLPGSEGDGVADVLLGEYDFTGTLSYTWPWYASDIVGKFDEENAANILFKRGTGLTKSGESLNPEGTVTIGPKPEKAEEELNMLMGGAINLSSTNYILEAENYNSDSYLVQTGNENNITFVEGWSGQWANTKWDVWIPEPGNYRLHFYIAAAKDANCVELYYASPKITDDGNANRTAVPMKKTESMMHYEEFTLDICVDAGVYEFKFMTNRANGADFRLDRIEFEYLG